MSDRHRALVVEDDPEAAADLIEILDGCGCDAVVCSNQRDALFRLGREPFCIILLDLNIKAEPDSIRGRVEHGKHVLRLARTQGEDLAGANRSLPIVVLSGHAAETEDAVAVMREGASDVVQKLATRELKLDRIHRALEHAGRTSHRACEEIATATATDARLVLSIPGEFEQRRVIVRLGRRRAAVTHSSLRILLHLIKGHLMGTLVDKRDLGAKNDRSFRGVSVLRNDLDAARDGLVKKLIVNDQRGGYGLAEHVVIGGINTTKLESLGHSFAKLAREIARLSEKLQGSAGKA